MKIIQCEQGTPEWLKARMGIPTASEFDNIVTPKTMKPRDGETVKTYLARKLVERWTGRPVETFSGGPMEQGSIREEHAIRWYESEFGVDIRRVGFVQTDDGRYGCSPDGLFDDDTGIECKCPEQHTHVKYLLAGVLPDQYAAQVQGSMLVTGANSWRFLSYRPDFPPLLLTIPRDQEACAKLRAAIEAFNATLDAAYAKLIKINGGEPDRSQFADDNTLPDITGDINAALEDFRT